MTTSKLMLYSLTQRENFGSSKLNRQTSCNKIIAKPLSISAKNFTTQNVLSGLVTKWPNHLVKYPQYIGKTVFGMSLEYNYTEVSGTGHFGHVHIQNIPAVSVQVSKSATVHPTIFISWFAKEICASCDCLLSEFIDFSR